MVDPIRKLSLVDFTELLSTARLTREIDAVHLHHTWRPRHKDFRGLATIEAMRRYHMSEQPGKRAWIDIAQHLTIDPAGGIWTGRNWNVPPASAVRHNGSSRKGPFMIEMVGDFDVDQDTFEDPQRESVVEVVAQLLRRFVAAARASPPAEIAALVRFHNEFSAKTCPGTGIDRDSLLADIAGRVAAPVTARAAALPPPPSIFASQLIAGSAVTRSLARWPPSEDEEVVESRAAGELIGIYARTSTAQRQRLERASRRVELADLPRARGGDGADLVHLRRHVINLSAGQLSTAGAFQTDPEDLVQILEGARDYAAGASFPPRIVIHAHGGLVNESKALEYASQMCSWWLGYGVYPIFLVWETGFFDIIRTRIFGARGDVSEALLEAAAKIPATRAWSAIKEDARRASSADAADGNPGGAYLFAQELVRFLDEPDHAHIELHAIGHSAGAVLHAHFLPLLIGNGLGIKTLSLLAPALRTDVFAEKVQPLIGAGIERLGVFTMEEDAERQDSVAGIYGKSLLYFVSRACEGFKRRPILGLYQSLRKDAALRTFFGIGGGQPNAGVELQLSIAPGAQPNPLTRALEHGFFDNDVATMSAVLRRILGRAPVQGDEGTYGSEGFPDFAPMDRDLEAPAAGHPSGSSAGAAVGSGARRALCIGIDAYRTAPLAGCVADAKTWGQTLSGLGFEVEFLFDRQATRDAILTGLRSLIAGARSGDILAFQYAGHGAQLADLQNDEADLFDETLVPYDHDHGAFLTDDDLAEVLSSLPSGVRLTLFMDCCHCGTNSRFAPLIAPRARAGAAERPRFLRVTAEQTEAHRSFRRARGSARAAIEVALPGVIHFAACQDDELAFESDGHGHFTTVATRMLVAAFRGGSTNEDFLRAVREEVARDGRQHPALLQPAPGMASLRLLTPAGT